MIRTRYSTCRSNGHGKWDGLFNFLFKGTVPRDFRLLVFFMNQLPPSPWAYRRAVSNFFENTRRYSQLKVDHLCRWHRWQMEKIFNQKNFNDFVLTPLGSRVNIYINFCLQVHCKVSAAWHCFHYWHRWQTCRRCRWYRRQFATGVVATGINNTNETGGKICRRCRWYR